MTKENIELFDRYLDGTMSAAEEARLAKRLKTDKALADDLRMYLFVVKGLRREGEQDNYELGLAIERMSRRELMVAIGKAKPSRPTVKPSFGRERLAWAASLAAAVMWGIAAVFHANKVGDERVDDLIYSYNYRFTPSRDDVRYESFVDPLTRFEREYAEAREPQDRQIAGLNLALTYIKRHDRPRARRVLNELIEQYSGEAEYEDFVAQCKRILSQLR